MAASLPVVAYFSAKHDIVNQMLHDCGARDPAPNSAWTAPWAATIKLASLLTTADYVIAFSAQPYQYLVEPLEREVERLGARMGIIVVNGTMSTVRVSPKIAVARAKPFSLTDVQSLHDRPIKTTGVFVPWYGLDSSAAPAASAAPEPTLNPTYQLFADIIRQRPAKVTFAGIGAVLTAELR